jgi:hypothetical protein
LPEELTILYVALQPDDPQSKVFQSGSKYLKLQHHLWLLFGQRSSWKLRRQGIGGDGDYSLGNKGDKGLEVTEIINWEIKETRDWI